MQTQLKGCTTEALLRPARKRKILEPQNPLVELKTGNNGKTRPFAVGDSQCAGEGARGDGERLYFFQFCFLKIAVKQKSTLTWEIFRRSCTIQRTSPLKEKMS